MVRDLTPEREWEEALRLSRQRFQRFFANAPVGIALLDRDGRLEEANRALGELLRLDAAASSIGQRAGRLSSIGEDRDEVAAQLADAADGPRRRAPGRGPAARRRATARRRCSSAGSTAPTTARAA